MSDTAWMLLYLGKPWKAGAHGPVAYDCWHLFRAVQKHRFQRTVPVLAFVDGAYDSLEEQRLHLMRERRYRWEGVPRPKEGDAVVTHRPLHIGVWLPYNGGGVLHAVEHVGVVWTKDRDWCALGFGERTYYRHAPDEE